MEERLQQAIWIILIVGVMGVFELVFAVYYLIKGKNASKVTGRVPGVVTGLLKSHLFKNEIHGEVPGGAIIGWGVAQGEQFWGGTLKLRIPPWFPCIKYEIDGKEYHRILGEGSKKGQWEIGQKVTIMYQPGKPLVVAIEGDKSYQNKVKLCAIVGSILLVICVIAIIYATTLV